MVQNNDTNKLSLNKTNTESSELDFMYQSLSELRKKCPKYERKIIKPARNKENDRRVSKNLTCVINNIFYTNGKPLESNENVSEIQDLIESKKILYDRVVSKIDDEKVLTQSDVITIDIDPQSTYLPLMCKLMIICEGAIVERGQCLLVRDFNTQVTHEDLNAKRTRSSSEMKSVQTDNELFNRGVQTDNYTEEGIRKDLFNIEQDLNKKFSSSSSSLNNSRNIHENNSIYKSFHDINELWSIPYYQYQKKNFNKHDFTINTTEKDINDYYRSLEQRETSRQRIPSYRNEMFMIINNDNRNYASSYDHQKLSSNYNDQYHHQQLYSNYNDHHQSNFLNRSFINENYHVKRSFIEERFSTFEAEVVISDQNSRLYVPEQYFPINNNSNFYERIEEVKNEEYDPNQGVTIRTHYDDSHEKSRARRSSVTSLILMQVKNGRIV